MQPGPIALASSGELIHHQLRVLHSATMLNAAYVRRNLVGLATEWSDAVVVNFNYDYWMARELWPQSSFVTVINDDFLHLARPWARQESNWAQRRTIEISSHTLAVSYPLVRQCLQSSAAVSLFLPWARAGYTAPMRGASRRDLLFWGYVDDRSDWDVIDGLANRGVTVHVVGPIRASSQIQKAFRNPRIHYHGVATLSEISGIIATCAASILPYALRRWNGEMTMSNRAFELLGCGLPLLHAAFPELLVAPKNVIYRCTGVDDYWEAWAAACSDFEAAQGAIVGFLAAHTPEARYRQLAEIFGHGFA